MRRIKSNLTAFAAGFCLSLSTAQAVEIAESPLFVTNTADPNILFILDDSGSMRWGFVPDELVDDISVDLDPVSITGDETLCPGRGTYAGVQTCFFPVEGKKAALSYATNPLYYNPSKIYTPPMKKDGTRYPNASYTDAWIDGYDSGNTGALTVNLSNDYRAIMDPYYRRLEFCEGYLGESGKCDHDSGSYEGFVIGAKTNTADGRSGDAGFYFNFTGGDSCSSAPFPDSCFSEALSPSTDDEKQNFANWFSYYRTRQLLSKAGVTLAFIDQSENMRVGYGAINEAGTIVRGVKPFSGDSRSQFFEWLQGTDAVGGTPLHRALQDAGNYYSRNLNETDNPWRTDTGSQESPEYVECRQSFTILMTDGYWDQPGNGFEVVGDQDGTDGQLITGPSGRRYKYVPADPFQAAADDTLADVAMKFWKTDLQTDIVNRVPTSDQDPAFWQHMNTYGVGLGVSGTIDPTDAFDAISINSAIAWPDPTAQDATKSSKIDDLLHASVNSRGNFFSAADPTTFGDELAKTIGQITEAVGSASGITFDTATLEEDSLMFSARFDSSHWQGDLDARPLIYNPGDTEPTVGNRVWSAAEKLDAGVPDDRVIITYNGSVGKPFRWGSLNASQQADLAFGAQTAEEIPVLGGDRLSYVRGDRSKEGDDFRVRASRLGDIVHSTPVRVARPASVWPDTEQFGAVTNRYSDFRAAKANRTPVIYVGANDGMLHGFKATEDGGQELLAYVPASVYSSAPSEGLHHLTSLGYSHQYYVDLSPLVTDVFTKGRSADGTVTSGRDWRTVLFGGLRAGGRGVFALDVTDPASFSENNAEQLALWEFSYDSADSRKNLGYNIQPPQVALADWGSNQSDYRWTAFISNGYNSDTESTGFFMLDVEGGIDGNWEENVDFRYIEFSTTGGGLSPLTLYDSNRDKVVDRVYAGDTAGRLWSAAKTNQGWGGAHKSGNKIEALFTTPEIGSPAVNQAITAAPMVIPNVGQKPASNQEPDTYVIFGTGKYLGFEDILDNRQQALYAVRDVGTGGRTISDLGERQLNEYQNYQSSGFDILLSEATTTSSSDDNGWYVNLFEQGERIYLTPQVRGEYIFATSIIPSTNPCVAGGESRIMAFGLDGYTPNKAVFRSLPFAASAFKKIDGIANPAAFLGDFMFTPTSGGGEPDIEGIDVGNVSDDLGRQGWQELIED